MIDFVFPENNEEEFIQMAKRLGYSGICFIYSLEDFKKVKCQNVSENNTILKDSEHDQKPRFLTSDFKVHTAILTDEKFEKAKQMADFVLAKANGTTRSLIERKSANFIYGFEESVKRDFTHYRNSGLNQVLCNLMREKNVWYFLSMTHLIGSEDPQFFGRVMQNLRFCNKFKVKVVFGSFALDPYEMRATGDAISLLKILGLNNSKSALY